MEMDFLVDQSACIKIGDVPAEFESSNNWKKKFETIRQNRSTSTTGGHHDSMTMTMEPQLDNPDTWTPTKTTVVGGQMSKTEPSKKELILMDELEWLRNRIKTIEKVITIKKEEEQKPINQMTPSSSLPQEQDQQQVDTVSRPDLVKEVSRLDHDRAIKRVLVQRHMRLLLHAHGCRWREEQSRECPTPFCQSVKNLLIHMKRCRAGRDCSMAHCYASRQIITFWKLCQISIQPDPPAPPVVFMPMTMTTDKKMGKTSAEEFLETTKNEKETAEHFQSPADTTKKVDPISDEKRLWCVCRRPENRRHMICCDGCNDWFHGSCVRVTKVEARKLDQQGDNWYCPICTGIKRRKCQVVGSGERHKKIVSE